MRNKESAEPVSKSDFKLNTVVTVTIYDLEEKEKNDNTKKFVITSDKVILYKLKNYNEIGISENR